VKEKLLQSWRYKTLAVMKRHKTTYLLLYQEKVDSLPYDFRGVKKDFTEPEVPEDDHYLRKSLDFVI